MIKAYGEFTVIKPVTKTTGSGLQVKGDGEAIVQSCPAYPELEGKKILYDDRHKFTEYEDYYIIRTEYIQALLEDLK
tara:strand:- start:208 stop:438 length:231 start_codon:yes stop_codon:yes gene_type:complete